MGLEIITLSEVNQTEKGKHHMLSLRMSNLKKKKKKDANVLIYRTETDLHTLKTSYCYQRGQVVGRNGLRVWDWHMHTEVHGMIS